MDLGIPRIARISGSQSRVSRSIIRVREALVTSVMWITAVHTPGQVPDQPGIDRPERTGHRSRRVPWNPRHCPGSIDFGSRKIGCQRQPDLGSEAVLTAFLSKGVADCIGAGILPDDSVVNWLPAVPVPNQGGLALVGDPDGGDMLLLQAAFLQRPDTTSLVRVQISFGSCSTQPGLG